MSDLVFFWNFLFPIAHYQSTPGDLSDEVGCYLPYVMASTGGVSVMSCQEMSWDMTYLHVMSCFVMSCHVMMSGCAEPGGGRQLCLRVPAPPHDLPARHDEVSCDWWTPVTRPRAHLPLAARYKQDLVRRKDKVKARNAENKRNNK